MDETAEPVSAPESARVGSPIRRAPIGSLKGRLLVERAVWPVTVVVIEVVNEYGFEVPAAEDE